MKLAVVTAALFVLTTPMALAQGAKAGDSRQAEEEIRQRLRAWDDAYKNRDTATLSGILADEYRMTNAAGAVLTKAQYLMSVVRAPDASRPMSYVSEDVKVEVSGDTAVVTGHSAVKGRGSAPFLPGKYRFIDRWIRHQGVWKAVSTEASRRESP